MGGKALSARPRLDSILSRFAVTPREKIGAAGVIFVLLVAGGAWSAPGAAAAVARTDSPITPITQTDNSVQVTLEGARTDSDGLDIYGDSLAPAFDIQVLDPGLTIQCHMNFDADGPCGVQQTTGCAAYQCWRYVGSLTKDGFAQMFVDEDFEDGGSTYFDYELTAISQPPTTTISPPARDERYDSPRADELASFEVGGDSGTSTPAAPISVQCTLSAGGAPAGPWRSCRIPRLGLLDVYTLRARAVDIFGRPDPTPAQTVFSPTPCRARVLGRVRTLGQIVEHGLRLSVRCIQATRYEVDLQLPNSVVSQYPVELRNENLGYGYGRTTKLEQTGVVTLHTFRGLPRVLFGIRRLPIDVHTIPLGPWPYGADHLRVLTVHG